MMACELQDSGLELDVWRADIAIAIDLNFVATKESPITETIIYSELAYLQWIGLICLEGNCIV